MRCESGIVSVPEIVALPIRTQIELRSKDTIATAAMQNLDRYFREDTLDAVLEMHV